MENLLAYGIAFVLMIASFFLGSFLRLAKVSKVLTVIGAFLGRLSDGSLSTEEAKATADEILNLFKK
jgi:adenylosuccinate synthase